ncbi:MAG: T9SS type A sorting domain-containing protein [Bacteroidota bacterium]|nr:T9SS type A sorting domain-containing protein [Bacteroidota bacterium]
MICKGQEVVTGLQINRLVKEGASQKLISKGIMADTIEIPFFDDFSSESLSPDPRKWSDNDVFINDTYSDKQITIGIATFDAIDNLGKLYETANTEGFEADHLTSQPLNLKYSPTDNIYLSFVYEAGGLGDPPELKDSLTLQFYAPVEAKWYSAWKATNYNPTGFRAVIIRIDNPRYLLKGFRFRFVNWASLAKSDDPSIVGNCDQWNVDYVYLNRNRNAADTIFADVAFRGPVRSLLKTHEAMPWKQFEQVYLQEMGSVIPIHYRNNDDIVRNVTRGFEIRDMYLHTVSYSFSAGAANIDPLSNVDYNASLIYTYNSSNNDSALFRVTCYLKTDDFDPKVNDTVKYDQVFSNYFAYDDGTSEGGYGINGQGSRNAMVANRFKSFMQDTLRAVSICFNDSYLNSNRRAFDLMIWDDNNDLPGNVLYSVPDLIAQPGEGNNGFYTYVLPDGVVVNDVFYAGWRQHSETFLNAGYDINTPNKGRQFYWINGNWFQTQKEGSIMIRPVVGHKLKVTSSDDTAGPVKKTFRLWPNPAGDYINIYFEDLILSRAASVTIIDLFGRELIRVPYSDRIDISSLKPGIYTVIATAGTRRVGSVRLIKTK